MIHSLKKIFSIVLLCCFAVIQLDAQNTDLLDKANKYYELQDYKQAIVTYLSVLKANPNEGAVYGKLANCYRFTNELNNSASWYIKAVNEPKANPEYFFQYGLVLKMLGKYKNANAYFTEYSKVNPTKGKAYANSCVFAEDRIGDTPLYTVTKEGISSTATDFAPTVYKGNILYVSSRTDLKNEMNDNDEKWKNGKFNQLLMAKPTANGTLGKPTVLKKEFKAKTNEGPLSFTEDGKRVAYTVNQFVNGVRQIPEAGAKMRIYMADVATADEWKKSKPFTYNKPDEYNTGYPSLSANGSVLYFASDMPGGYGGMDIYVCYKTGDNWSGPQNLGERVNTPGDEIAPFIDGNALYFSSNYLPGFGGMDVFRAEYINNKWSKILHLGTGVNTPSDDYGLVFNNGTGYLTSNRGGNADIYKVKITSERIEVVVLNDNEQPVSGAKIDFSSCGETAVYTDKNGRFKFIANSGLNCKGVVVSKKGYDSKTISVSASNKDLRLIEVRLNRIANVTGRYVGTVVDSKTEKVVPEVAIEVRNMLNKQTVKTFTDAQGRYVLELDPKTTYVIKYVRNNYAETSRTVLTGDGSDKNILSIQLLESSDGKIAGRDDTEVVDVYEVVDGKKDVPNYNNLPKVAFDIQFGVFSEPDRSKFNQLRGYGYIYSQRRTGNLKAYKVGAFRTRAEAEAIKEKVRELGYEGAFVTTITEKDMMAQVLIRKPRDNNSTKPPGADMKPPAQKPTQKPTPIAKAKVYKLQLGAYNNPKFFDKSLVEGLGEISYLPTGNGVTLVLLGEFKNYKDAKLVEEKVKERGGTAMVVAIENGKKVPLGNVQPK